MIDRGAGGGGGGGSFSTCTRYASVEKPKNYPSISMTYEPEPSSLSLAERKRVILEREVRSGVHAVCDLAMFLTAALLTMKCHTYR